MSSGLPLDDFRKFFEGIAELYLVLLPNLTIAAVNNAYLQATMTTREEIVGRHLFEVFPDNSNDLMANGVENLRASLEKVLQTRQPDVMPTQRYDVRRPASQGGEFEERYWSPANSPILDDSGEVAYLVHCVKDITELVRLKQARREQDQAAEELRDRAEKIESEVFRQAQEAEKTNQKLLLVNEQLELASRETTTANQLKDELVERLKVAETHYRSFVAATSQIFWMADAEGNLLNVSDWERLTGKKLETIRDWGWLDSIHPNDREETERLWTEAIKNKTPYHVEHRLRAPDRSYRWFAASAVPILNEDGTVREWIGASRDITGRKRTEDAMHESQARLQLALQAGRAGTFKWDIKRNINVWSPELEELYGVPVGTFEGNLESWAKRVVPEDAQRVTAGIEKALRERQDEHDFEFRAILPDNSHRWLAGRARFEYDVDNQPLLMIGINIDITERKRAEEALRESEERFRHLADHAPVMVWVTEPNGCCSFLSQSWYKFTGQTTETGLNFGWVDAVHPDDHDYTHNAFVRANEKHEAFQIEYRLRRHDGTYRWAIDSAAPRLSPSGEFMGYIGSVIDITDRKQAEEEREQLLKREQAARAEAENANRLKDEFLATVSHELRTPLNAILGWSRLLSEGLLDEIKTQRAVETIERNAKVQAQLIEDILDVSRIITGKLRLDVRAVNPSEVIEAAVDTVRPAADAKGIKLHCILDAGANTISGDPDRLQQIVWNLLSNAIKFTPKGGRVQIRLERRHSHVEIVVTDNGQGIDSEVLPFIFERFRQADSSTTRLHGGLGLGLAIVRHLVELHGGTIKAESAGADQGAVFTVTFPLMAVRSIESFLTDEKVEEPELSSTSNGKVTFVCPPELKGLRIVIVDDEPDTRHLLASVLEKCQSKVVAVASAREALAAIETELPDVLVSDVGMPEEDGYELIKKVRQLPSERGGRTPAVALTAYARVEDRMRVLSAGFQMHIPKPVEPAELIAIIANLAGWNRLAKN